MDSLTTEYYNVRATFGDVNYQTSISKRHKELLDLVFEPRKENKGLHVLAGRECAETVQELEDALFCCNLTKGSNHVASDLFKLVLIARKVPQGRWWVL